MRYASVSYALRNNTVFRRAQNWVSVSDGSRTDNGSEFQSVGRETAKRLKSVAPMSHMYANSLVVHTMGRVARFFWSHGAKHARKVARNRTMYLNHWNQCDVATLGREVFPANNCCKSPKVVARLSKSSPKSSRAKMSNFRAPTAAQIAQLALFRPTWQPWLWAVLPDKMYVCVCIYWTIRTNSHRICEVQALGNSLNVGLRTVYSSARTAGGASDRRWLKGTRYKWNYLLTNLLNYSGTRVLALSSFRDR